jgi:DNA-binding FadR family transcriptional regulator
VTSRLRNRKERLHRDAVGALLASIIEGRYRPGERLPKEQLLVEEFGMSRGTVREALRALEERHIVLVTHGRGGAEIQPAEEWNVLDPIIGRALATARKRRAFVAEVQHCRLIVESEAARLAADRASDDQRAELQALAGNLEEGGDVAESVKRIRRLVAAASRNRPLAATLRALDESVAPRLRADDADACARMASAVAEGDADAAWDAARALNAAR